jgi:hypothetical protein
MRWIAKEKKKLSLASVNLSQIWHDSIKARPIARRDRHSHVADVGSRNETSI